MSRAGAERAAAQGAGRLRQAQREREQEPAFRGARRVHAAVESAINNIWLAP